MNVQPFRGLVRFRAGCVAFALAAAVCASRVDALAPAPSPASNTSAAASPTRASWTAFRDATVDVSIVDLALRAASCAEQRGLVERPETLTVIDYSRRSVERRLWVFDLETGRVLHRELVAHGQGTGGDRATSFSNRPDSHQSSLGLFVTGETYVGRNGYSLRLDGLEPGFNDRARERAIVVHGAPYVSDAFARAQGRLGRSWGCPVLGADAARTVIDRIKGGDLVFAYYPDATWLESSTLLNGCGSRT